MKDYIYVIKTDAVTGEFLEDAMTCASFEEAEVAAEQFANANEFPNEVDYVISNERLKNDGDEQMQELVEILNEIGTEILNTMYSNGYADPEGKFRSKQVEEVIAAGALLEELTLKQVLS